MQEFTDILSKVIRGNLCYNTSDTYKYFLKVFSSTYDLPFPLKPISIKRKTQQNPWTTYDF